MLFLVSGASRSGKTRLSRRVLANKRIPYLSLDWLMMGFNDGMPDSGIHHLLWPDEIAEKMEPFLLGMINSMLVDGMDYVIEGEAMLPGMVADLVKHHSGNVRAVFLGYAKVALADKVAEIKKYGTAESDWLTRLSDDFIADHIENMIVQSQRVEAACREYRLPYFDTGEDFLGAVDAAADFLVEGFE